MRELQVSHSHSRTCQHHARVTRRSFTPVNTTTVKREGWGKAVVEAGDEKVPATHNGQKETLSVDTGLQYSMSSLLTSANSGDWLQHSDRMGPLTKPFMINTWTLQLPSQHNLIVQLHHTFHRNIYIHEPSSHLFNIQGYD